MLKICFLTMIPILLTASVTDVSHPLAVDEQFVQKTTTTAAIDGQMANAIEVALEGATHLSVGPISKALLPWYRVAVTRERDRIIVSMFPGKTPRLANAFCMRIRSCTQVTFYIRNGKVISYVLYE